MTYRNSLIGGDSGPLSQTRHATIQPLGSKTPDRTPWLIAGTQVAIMLAQSSDSGSDRSGAGYMRLAEWLLLATLTAVLTTVSTHQGRYPVRRVPERLVVGPRVYNPWDLGPGLWRRRPVGSARKRRTPRKAPQSGK